MRCARWVALAAIIALTAPTSAAAQVTVGPYFMVIVDSSGSMTSSTGGGTNSCGLPRNRMSDAKCVLQDVINGYGEATVGVQRFRQSCSGSCSSSSCDDTCGCSCSTTCNTSAASGEVLVPIQEGNTADALEWVDYTCATCGSVAAGTQPELHATGPTPLAGSLRAAREYYEGNDPRFGTSPIAADAFSGCRPYYVILLTDGAETCGGTPANAAAELRTTNVGGTNHDVRTFVIGFGITPGNAQAEAIAVAGGTDAPGGNNAFYASDETSLALAFSQIMADAILYEQCNGVDDDCDTLIDEGFALFCDIPGGGGLPATLCVDPGETICDGIDDNCDGDTDEGLLNACGVCGATPPETCDGADNDCDAIIDEGVCGGCIPGPELCNGLDDDCDTLIDETLTRPCGTTVGECTTGTETCAAGSWGVCSAIGPSAEVCDGLDNDCDGVIDGITRPCGSSTGECRPGSQLCTVGAWGACTGAAGPTAEICDALDNDCDGSIDEGDPGGGAGCGSGIGECSPGTLSCLGGALTCTGGVSPTAEVCDGLDNDCDGPIDEAVPTMGACGSSTGVCSPGVLTCTGGAFTCAGGTGPSAEACDGLDNDCDGPIDEGDPGGGGACGSSTGACVPGTLTCSGGALSCVGGVNPSAETCDGVDEDCDGPIDEGNPGGGAPCGSSTGACVPGTFTCTAGALACSGGTGPAAETCDLVDNDCDGSIDEGNPEGGASCGTSTGACSPGSLTCVGGSLSCTGATGPVVETCDNLDNDCDGPIDEGDPGGGAACGTSTGVCTPGTLSCVGGTLACAGGAGPSAETCDGFDEDCDGLTDEGNPGGGGACGTSTGACTPGVNTCSGGAIVCVGAGGPTPEVCDSLDNDCDGPIDEGDPGGGAACGSALGLCVPGTLTCTAGTLACSGGTGPVAELCDAADNDCDGNVDEEVPTAGACGSSTGECSEGVQTCVAGTFECVGDRGPTPDICDSLDNDCDGPIDEGNPGGGVACGSATGVCSLGMTECLVGRLECTGGTPPVAETCDGTDEDCDGLIDEGNPEGGTSCGASDVGGCEFGALACMSGMLTCVGETGPGPEICDGLDNDCDGLIDEGDPEGGTACGDGTGECVPGITACTGGMLECMGAVGPSAELCDGLDNNCNGVVDEGLPIGAPCGTDTGECVPGVNICRGGAIVCEGALSPVEETCDTLDNDCDGTIDEGLGLGGSCGVSEGTCMPGMLQCVAGREICVGEVPPGREGCDCEDNDCDGVVDEAPDTGALCPGESSCVMCQCALECQLSEFGFTCPTGRAPFQPDPEGAPDTCFCVAELCNAMDCATESQDRDGTALCAPDSADVASCVCRNNACTFSCDGVVCADGTVCNPRDPAGRCVEDSCRALGCGEGEICDGDTGECGADPCVDVTCGDDEACRDGVCERSCAAVECPAGEICTRGMCAAEACAEGCAATEVCDPESGTCVADACRGTACPMGTVCEPLTGECGANPCEGVRCPEGQVCGVETGECEEVVVPSMDAGTPDATVDAGVDATVRDRTRILATGGGGFGCTVSTTGTPDTGAGLLVLGLFGLLMLQRRRRSRGPKKALPFVVTLGVVLAAQGLVGCEVDPFCLDCDDDAGVDADTGMPDVMDGAVVMDTGVLDTGVLDTGVLDTGTLDGDVCLEAEACNGVDDDCDGLVDEGIDTMTDVDHCGGCDMACAPVGAFGECVAGVCGITSCDVGRHDIDGDPTNGCEYRCLTTDADDSICDLRDNDCDNIVDEDVDLATDVNNCGMCGRTCLFSHASATCVAGACELGACDPDFFDDDGLSTNGCEYSCVVASPATEACNVRDDDCDGTIDEGNPGGGGACGSAVGSCAEGVEECRGGRVECVGETAPVAELCNGDDDDCDSLVDEGNPEGGRLCGTSVGICVQGRETCVTGALTCVGAVAPDAAETCNGLDDDCDGIIDEGDPGGGGSCGTDAGACAFGTEHCRGGVVACEGATGPTDEVCDAVDNDCDASTDEGNPGGGGSCGTDIGTCTPGTRTCTAGALVCVGEVGGDPETCDSLDNDCDGTVDEGNPEGGASCGTSTGECSAGMETCLAGALRCTGATGASVEVCDGLDNDCDGSIDEGNPGGGAACGTSTGACTSGTNTCMGGAITCVGGTGPGPETCDIVDNDCDGSVDEGNPGGGGACGTSTGACTTGTEICLGGSLQCSGGTRAAPERCNGVDDDCDASTDEGNPEGGSACGTSTGVCSPGTTTCAAGSLTCSGGAGPGAEACNSLDDDCDGNVDEGNPGGGASCGTSTGSCTFGTMVCSGGAVSCTGGTGPSAETCDGADNDCDGSVDEGNPGGGASCGIDTGACTFGSIACVAGSLTCTGGTGAGIESCNLVDDDCDTFIDEGNPGGGGLCGTDVGQCSAGTQVCSGGALSCVGAVGGGAESCNALDDDCDGSIDEGNPGGGANCGTAVGTCSFGSEVCLGGTIQCSGGTGPVLETCDSFDNDCDASADEDFNLLTDPSNCGDCGVGCSFPNAAAGCSGGSCALLFCDPGWIDVDGMDFNGCEYNCSVAGAEACNGADDDCDLLIDEGVASPSNFCNPNGVCAGTSASCSGAGGWTCVYPATHEVVETTCDSLDNDCDGAIDEPFPSVGTFCANGTGACRTTGSNVCNAMGDGTVCNAAAPGTPVTEVCNGIDDDCDDTLDEGLAGDWVPFTAAAGTRYIFAHEASRPDSTAVDVGSMTHRACSLPSRQPWTNLTHPEAEAACAASGGRLCSEEEWQSACEAGSSCGWSYAASCTTYQPATCNGNDYDVDPGTAGDQDGVLPTASLASCYANWGGADRVYDMSGNAEEWTSERQPGVNPVRGGSNNDTAGGIGCDFDFVVADDTIQLPTVGFRCCRSTPPTCDDGAQNAGESDVDCGGPCAACPVGGACTVGADCGSGVCMGGTCRAPNCSDGAQNGGETDIDCGGATACPRCPDLDMCNAGTDCVSGGCFGGLCRSFSCSTWGTDAFGYVGCSATTGTPPCDDIQGTGTPLGLGDDDFAGVPIGFSFDFYGTSYTTAYVQSNGAVSFDSAEIAFGNSCLPSGGSPSRFLATFWDDLNPSNGGNEVYYQTLGVAPNRRLVVQWRVEHFSSTPNVADFRAVFHESGDMDVCYVDPVFGDASFDNGLSATAGIQAGGVDDLQFSCNAANLTTGLFLNYAHP